MWCYVGWISGFHSLPVSWWPLFILVVLLFSEGSLVPFSYWFVPGLLLPLPTQLIISCSEEAGPLHPPDCPNLLHMPDCPNLLLLHAWPSLDQLLAWPGPSHLLARSSLPHLLTQPTSPVQFTQPSSPACSDWSNSPDHVAQPSSPACSMQVGSPAHLAQSHSPACSMQIWLSCPLGPVSLSCPLDTARLVYFHLLGGWLLLLIQVGVLLLLIRLIVVMGGWLQGLFWLVLGHHWTLSVLTPIGLPLLGLLLVGIALTLPLHRSFSWHDHSPRIGMTM